MKGKVEVTGGCHCCGQICVEELVMAVDVCWRGNMLAWEAMLAEVEYSILDMVHDGDGGRICFVAPLFGAEETAHPPIVTSNVAPASHRRFQAVRAPWRGGGGGSSPFPRIQPILMLLKSVILSLLAN